MKELHSIVNTFHDMEFITSRGNHSNWFYALIKIFCLMISTIDPDTQSQKSSLEISFLFDLKHNLRNVPHLKFSLLENCIPNLSVFLFCLN